MAEEILGDAKGVILRSRDSKDDSKQEEGGDDGEGCEVASGSAKPVTKSFRARNGIGEELKGGSDDLNDDHEIAFEESHEKTG